MNIRDGRFGRRNQIQFPERVFVVAFRDAVVLVLEFWKLPNADQALWGYHERRRNLGVTVLVGVQIEEKLNKRAFQFCAPICVENEAAAGKFRRAGKVHELQMLTNLHVRLRFECEICLLSKCPHDRIFLGAFSHGNGLVRQVRHLQHQPVAVGIAIGNFFVELSDAIAEFARFLFPGFGFLYFFLPHQGADFLGHFVALRFKRFDFGEEFATLLVRLQDFLNERFVPCPAGGEALTYKIRLLANQFNVQHARHYKYDLSQGKSEAGRSALHIRRVRP